MATPESISVLTWNILCDSINQDTRLTEIATVVTKLSPDVLCIQESWPGATARLAHDTGMNILAQTTGNPKMGTAVLSRLPLSPGISSEQFDLPGWDSQGVKKQGCAATVVSHTGRRWRFTSAHLSWGSDREPTRVQQAQYLDDLASAAEARGGEIINVLCGDLNALPQSRTLRYLTGLDIDLRGNGTMWVDAWNARGDGQGYTSDPTLAHAEAVAKSVGIQRVELLPHRRIDYVLVRGFAYGRPGCPLAVDLVPGGTATDHHGITATLWDPSSAQPA